SQGTEGKTAPYVKDANVVIPELAESLNLPAWPFSSIGDIKTHAVENAPLAPAPQNKLRKWPLIVFSHGFNGLRSQSTVLMEELASHGYIILAPQHSYDSAVTVFPSGRKIEPKAKPPKDLSLMDEDELRGEWTDRRVGELRSLLALVFAGKLPDKELNDSIDLSRVAVLGHSMGGSTISGICRELTDIKACVNLDGPIRGTRQKGKLLHPMLFVEAELPQYKNDEQKNLYLTRLKEFEASAGAGFIYAQIKGIGHFDFTDAPFLSSMPLHWMTKTLGSLDGKRTLQIQSDLIRQFLKLSFEGKTPKVQDLPQFSELEYKSIVSK
ncbi:MAG: hypothetical protein EOP09_13370, partial [Proteobacteria bacterium]